MKNFFFAEGNIGRDPVLKYVPVKGESKAVLEMSVRFSFDKLDSVSGEYKDNGGFWGTVSYWGKRAEAAHKTLRAGVRVFVVGEQSQEEYIASKGEREGQVVTTTNINATHIGLSLLGIESVVFSPRRNRSSLGGDQSAGMGADNGDAEAEYYAQTNGQ